MTDCNLKVGLFDRIFHTASVTFNECRRNNTKSSVFSFSHLKDSDKAYQLIQDAIYNGGRDSDDIKNDSNENYR